MGGQLVTSAPLCLTHTLHSNLTASQQISKACTAPHLHTCHLSPLLPDLITSSTALNSLKTFLLSQTKSKFFGEFHEVPFYSLNSYLLPQGSRKLSLKSSQQFSFPGMPDRSAHTCDCTCYSKWKFSLLLSPPPGPSYLVSMSPNQWLPPWRFPYLDN